MAGRPLDFHQLIRIYGRVRVEVWKFTARDPHLTFHITLGRLPDGCAEGAWWVDVTDFRAVPLVFDSEADARIGMHDEGLRFQRMCGPGRWSHVDLD